MLALAKFWTWIGNLFIPLAIGWAVYVRGGLTDRPPPIGVLVSRAYWGVLVSLVAGGALIWAMVLYVRLAKRKNAVILAPPNTAFEDESVRSRIISWATVFVFTISVLFALTVFGVRYMESQIHKWDDQQPLQSSFWGSRVRAYEIGCVQQPCFAIEQRVDAGKNPIFGVNEYILYLTDGVLVLPALFMLAGAFFLMREFSSRPPTFTYEL
jgi:hypothetical protein